MPGSQVNVIETARRSQAVEYEMRFDLRAKQ